MKGVILSGKQMGWEKKLLGVSNRLELPVLNKCLFEYYLDLFHLSGVEEVIILQDEVSSKVMEETKKYQGWFKKIEIKNYNPEKTIEEEVCRYQKFLSKKEVFLIESSGFVLYDKENGKLFEMDKKRNNWITSDFNNTSFLVRDISEIKDLYELNLCLLKKYQSNYSLKGYEVNNNFYGLNNKVYEPALIDAHIHVGNDVTIEKESEVKGHNVIGDQVFLSGGCQLENTVLLDNVIINKPLNLKRKVVTANKIICPDSGAYLETDEDISYSSKMDISIGNFLVRYLIGLFILPISIFLSFLVKYSSMCSEMRFVNNLGQNRDVFITNIQFLDSMIWLGEFCKGNIRLIGAKPSLENEVEAGVFRPEVVFGEDGFANGHTSFLTSKNSYPYELSLILGSLK